MTTAIVPQDETPTTAPEPTPTPIPDLGPADMCDQNAGTPSGAGQYPKALAPAEQAYVRVAIPRPSGGYRYLDLCGHHFTVNEAELNQRELTEGYRILDRRERLSASAEGAEVS